MTKDDRACALIILGIAIAACIGAFQHEVGTFSDPGPGFFPLGLGLVLGVLSVIIFSGGVLAKRAAGAGTAPAPAASRKLSKEALYVVAALAAYGLLLIPLGFILTTFVVFTGLLWVVARQNWPVILGGAAILAVGAYVIFDVLLGVTLPRGILGF